MPQSWLKNIWRAETGAAAVEFAIVSPLLMLLFVGFMEYANLLYDQQQLEKSTRDAARYLSYYDQNSGDSGYSPWSTTSAGAVCGSSTLTVEQAAENLVLYASLCTGSSPIVAGMTSNDITITPGSTSVTASAGTCSSNNSCSSCTMTIPTVTVSVQTPYSDIIGLLSFLGISSVTLAATHEERVLANTAVESCT